MSTTVPSSISTKSPTIRRILREAAELSKTPSPDYTAEPLEADLFEWHFTLRGPPNSVYSEGLYHGKIVLPPAYPLRPPSFRFTTPSGRFEANREICLSISGHHEETWQPAWGIRTALVALRSFMETDARGQLGGLETTDEVRRRFAKESSNWICVACAKSNAEIMNDCENRYNEETNETKKEVEVPQELKMAFRDELSAGKSSNSLPTTGVQSNGSQPALRSEQSVEKAVIYSSYSRTEPTSTLRNRHDNVDNQRPGLVQGQQPNPPQAEAPPLWLDRAIVILSIVLAALLIKVLFGL
ncbi:hypothetical protein Golomagni_06791 [Golovinomyces magnicellulatus]|nr:hypothetical protein Golomagni_06791 [Golovinomyces magnicellulatus]